MNQIEIKCPKHLNITMIDAFHEQIAEDVSIYNSILLDLSDVEKADTTGLQLLCSIDISMKKKGGSLALKNINEEVQAVFNTLGLKEHFVVEI
jgi:anti-anti-sigma factor